MKGSTQYSQGACETRIWTNTGRCLSTAEIAAIKADRFNHSRPSASAGAIKAAQIDHLSKAAHANHPSPSASAIGCWGVSPTGVRWAYLMPRHTGTGTGQPYLSNQLKVRSCGHEHHAYVWRESNATFAFAFVANPFRRLLSSAAWNSVISGGKTYHAARETHDEVAAFRRWVLKARPERPLALQVDFLRGAPVGFVGRTATIERDLPEALGRAGYQVERLPPIQTSHCVASCAKAGQRTVHTAAEHSQLAASAVRQVRWYDEATARRAVEWYAADFEAFNFSTDPADMYDT